MIKVSGGVLHVLAQLDKVLHLLIVGSKAPTTCVGNSQQG